MIRRTLLRAALALPLTGFLLPSLAMAADPDGQQFVHDLAQRAISTAANPALPKSERDEHFRRLFVSSFDIPEIGRFVLGRYWRAASPDQQQEFLKLFEDINVLVWTKRFEDYKGETLEAGVASKEGERSWLVESQIMRNQGPPIPVRWRLRQADDGSLRVVDIIVEGVSMALTNRSDYAATLQASGGKLDPLLASMRAKISQLRAG